MHGESHNHKMAAPFSRERSDRRCSAQLYLIYQWCILIVMSVKSSFYNEYDIKNNEKPVFWAQRGFQNHHQTFHDRCPEKIGPLPKKSDHWSTRTCPENIRPAPTWLYTTIENPSYFFITLSCTEAIQSFISHFNQYSLVDPSWGNIPSWV